MGLETEYALGFVPAREGGTVPPHDELFRALVDALKTRARSCEAAYSKGGDFFENGSLVHFEPSTRNDAHTGLLEWATPECLGAREAALYARSQERALAQAIPLAERELAARGQEGRLVVLKCSRDRFGDDFGCHESYDVADAVRGSALRAFAVVAQACLASSILIVTTGFSLLIVIALALAVIAARALARVLPKRPGRALLHGVQSFASWVVEPGPYQVSGLLDRANHIVARLGERAHGLAARRYLFAGLRPAIVPFLATRAIYGGTGELLPDGRYEVSARARALRRECGSFISGPSRPMIDWKEYYLIRPSTALRPRKRLHLLIGEPNRTEYAEALKLGVTAAVLDAAEAGALDRVARGIELAGGAIGALRRTSADPTLRTAVARDRATRAPLTAIDVQRRYVEAVWEHFRAKGSIDDETKDALVRWSFILDRLQDDASTLDRELDWVVKLKLIEETLLDAMPSITPGERWVTLAVWGEANAEIERAAPDLELGPIDSTEPLPAEAVRAALLRAIGERRTRRIERKAARARRDLGELSLARRAWLRAKAIDLKYHEISVDGGAYDWLAASGLVARVHQDGDLDRAFFEPPRRTRARIRSEFVRRAAAGAPFRVGWDRIEIGWGAAIELDDPYQHEVLGRPLRP
jgi:hypothetical protein